MYVLISHLVIVKPSIVTCFSVLPFTLKIVPPPLTRSIFVAAAPPLDRIVIDYLVELAIPESRTQCGFTDDVNTTVARASAVFSLDRDRFLIRLQGVFEAEGSPPSVARCLAEGIIDQGSDSVVVYARLGVQAPDYLDLRQRLSCTGVP